jgi:hypothetical protein
MLIVFRTAIASNAWAALPVAFVLFAPSHYMEFMWGFQFVMAMSIVLPVLGLAVFNRTTPQESTGVFSARLSCALGLIIGGFLSSAIGAFGVPALLVLALFKRLSIVRRCIVVSITSLGFGVPMMVLLLTEPSGHFRNAQILHGIMAVLPALGVVLVGSPVGLTTFSLTGPQQ